MFCQYCGQRNEDTSQSCTACQKPLSPATAPARQKPVGRVNKGFYLGSVAAGGLLGLLLITSVTVRIQRNPYDLGSFPLLFLGEMIVVYAGVVSAVLLYKSWKAI